jgi:hypothetical protein
MRYSASFRRYSRDLLVSTSIANTIPAYSLLRFEVAFDTSFEALQALRARMLNFCKENSRDFLPIFDVVVDDIPGQGKMVLKADIKWARRAKGHEPR